MKDFIRKTEHKLSDLTLAVQQKDQEVGFLRSMLGTLSAKMEKMEQDFDLKLGNVDSFTVCPRFKYILCMHFVHT